MPNMFGVREVAGPGQLVDLVRDVAGLVPVPEREQQPGPRGNHAVEGQPQYAGRQPYKNVAIANSDSEAFAYTHSAINEAHRAVQDLPSL